jgi:hypothetical protein
LESDYPVPELTEQEDAQTLRAIAAAIAQLDAGEGVPLDEVRRELDKRRSK